MYLSFSPDDIMHILVLFDLPTQTSKQRALYSKFRKMIMAWGFDRIQNSVYIRDCENNKEAKMWEKNVRVITPPNGEVMILRISERVYSEIVYIQNKKRKDMKPTLPPILLF